MSQRYGNIRCGYLSDEDRSESDVARQARNSLILFVLSSVVFGLVLSFLAWAMPYFLPQWLAPRLIMTLSIGLLAALGILAYYLIIRPFIKRDNVYCYLVYDMKKGSVIFVPMLSYEFWYVASLYFDHLVKQKPEQGEILTKPLDLKSGIIGQLMLFSILHWLTQLNMSVAFAAYRLRVPLPPRIYNDPNEKMRTHHHSYFTRDIENTFSSLLKESTIPHIMLPRSMHLKVNDDKVTISNRYLTIGIGYQAYQWQRGADQRVSNLLKLEEDSARQLGSVSAVITFEAKLARWSVLFPKADSYWHFAEDMLANLRLHYDWGRCLEDVREILTWERLTKSGT
jgi:hypothetical protein